MLSKTEIEFLKNPTRFDADYRRVMRHRVKAKAEEFRAQIALLQGCEALGVNGLSVTENCNGVTEFCNGQQNQKSVNQASLINQGQSWSLRRDLDPRPLPYQGAQIIEPMSFRAFNWPDFKKYVQNKYRKTTAKRVMCYANRYYHVLAISGNSMLSHQQQCRK